MAFFSRGLTALTPSAFNAVADQIILWNKVLTGNSRFIAEPALADKFLDLMQKELGLTKYTELKREFDSRAWIEIGGIGCVEKTRNIIVDFLTKDVTVALKDGITATPGKALRLKGYPNKDGHPREESNGLTGEKRTPQEREAAGEQPPGLCPIPGCGKNHWLHNCKTGKNAVKMAATQGRGKAKQLADALAKAAELQSKMQSRIDELDRNHGDSASGVCKLATGSFPSERELAIALEGRHDSGTRIDLGPANAAAHGQARVFSAAKTPAPALPLHSDLPTVLLEPSTEPTVAELSESEDDEDDGEQAINAIIGKHGDDADARAIGSLLALSPA